MVKFVTIIMFMYLLAVDNVQEVMIGCSIHEDIMLLLKEKDEVLVIDESGSIYVVRRIEDKDKEDDHRKLCRRYSLSVEDPHRIMKKLGSTESSPKPYHYDSSV